MFVSQVTFEGTEENDEMLRQIMKKKLEDAKVAPGIQSAECWRENKENTASYTLVMKWSCKEDFKAWMVKSHSGRPHGGGRPSEDRQERPKITKQAHQYEVVEF